MSISYKKHDSVNRITAEEEGQTIEDENDEDEARCQEQQRQRYSLNSVYGNRIGLIQSLSLLLNAGLMVYAHVGVAGVFLSNHPRIEVEATDNNNINNNNTLNNSTENLGNYTGACNADDFEIWKAGGSVNKSDHSNFCATQYNYGTRSGCFFDQVCTMTCFEEQFGYTRACAGCFAPIPYCSFLAGCATICGAQPNSAQCAECTAPCNEEFYACTGLLDLEITRAPTLSPTADPDALDFIPEPDTLMEVCERQQLGVDPNDVKKYYVVYEMSFFRGIKAAWNGDARLLAVIVMMFSGIWPYSKNIILMFAWYLPMTEKRRSGVLLWLRRLGKYTLVDIYLVIILIIGVFLKINVAGGTALVIKGEPRFAIIAFLFATLWEYVHIEWMTQFHHIKLSHYSRDEQEQYREPEGNVLDSLRFQSRFRSDRNSLACKSPACLQVALWLLLCLSIGLFLTGSIADNIRFTSTVAGETEGCVRSYSLYSLGTALVSPFSLQMNSSKPWVWILFFAYIILLAVIPLFVHLVHVLVCVLNVKMKGLCRAADICWTFASVDVFLIALYVVQYKFDAMIGTMAGNEGSQFFGINAELGPGFFILIVYSVFAGLFEYFFHCAVYEHYQIDVHEKINFMWTMVFGRLLRNATVEDCQTTVNHEGTESTLQAKRKAKTNLEL